MITPKLRELDYVKAWGFFWLLATFGGFIVGAFAGAILGAILGAAGVDLGLIKILAGILGFAMAIPISYLLFRFSIVLFILPKITLHDDQLPPPPATQIV